MELQLVNKEQAEMLKAIGYAIPTYEGKDVLPYMALAIKWLREIKKIFISPRLGYENGKENWLFCMHLENYTPLSFDNIHFEQELWAQYNYKNYEEAESAGLSAALKYIKSNKEGE
jgi:hypothetical protein